MQDAFPCLLPTDIVTLDRARQLLKIQADFGSFYNANSAKLILSEVQKEHGQEAVDQLIRELELDRVRGLCRRRRELRQHIGRQRGEDRRHRLEQRA